MAMRTTIALASLVLGLASTLHAQPLFEQNAPLTMELTGPLGSLVEHKEERSKWPFSMNVGGQELDLQIRARGNSRMRICEFPQLKFYFNRDETVDSPFEGLDSVKLVNSCRAWDRYQIDVLEEYASYRIFELLSDVSIRARLVHITFNDTDDRIHENLREAYAFFIEPPKQFAARVHGQLPDIPAVTLGSLDQKQAALVYVFQYLIANTDWSLVAPEGDDSCCHNIRLIDIDSKLYPVPYDFDLAGLVSASYARPDPSLRIKKVRSRLYRGYCTNPDTLREAISHVTSKETEVTGIIENLPLLSEKEKAKQVDYLAKFFDKARDENKLAHNFEKKCLH